MFFLTLVSTLTLTLLLKLIVSQCEVQGGTERKSVREVLERGKRSAVSAPDYYPQVSVFVCVCDRVCVSVCGSQCLCECLC